MADRDHYLKLEMIGRETFPSLDTTILGLIGIEEDLPEEDKNSSTKIEQELPQEEDPILLWDVLVANVTVVTVTRKHFKKLKIFWVRR